MMKKTIVSVLFLLAVYGACQAQVLSEFLFEDPGGNELIATIGPNATSSGCGVRCKPSGNGSPRGLNTGITGFGACGCGSFPNCPVNVNMSVPNIGNLFNVTNPLMSIDYRHFNSENGGAFFQKDQLFFGLQFEKITGIYTYDNGVGGCVTPINFAAYPPAWVTGPGNVPRDGVWRTYTFSYDPASGVASISVSNPAHTELSFGVAGMNFCGWTAAALVIGSSIDNLRDSTNTILDNSRYGRLTVTPVLLDYFKGDQVDHEVELSWKTASQSNHQSFLVYRSEDGNNWTEISRVFGEANTQVPQDYTFRDKTPYRGLNFYRIVQVDQSGATTGYPSIKVNMEYAENGLLALYPNPINFGTLHLQFDAEDNHEPALLTVVSLDGRVMGKQGYELKSGINDLEYNIDQLATGLYIAKITYRGKTHSQRFSVMK